MEQGMSSALLVEKTSKRGGRIVHEKDIMPPPPPVVDVAEKKKEDPPITEIMKNPSKVRTVHTGKDRKNVDFFYLFFISLLNPM